MQVAICSTSRAVARSLARLVEAAGHRVTERAEDADLTLYDTRHAGPDAAPEGAWRLGGDIPCPVAPQALLQKLSQWHQPRLTALGGGWGLDRLARQLTHPEHSPVSLTEKECALLGQLALAPGQKMAREALLEAVWGVGSDIDTHTLETHVYRLRNKLSSLTPPPGDLTSDTGAYRLVTID